MNATLSLGTRNDGGMTSEVEDSLSALPARDAFCRHLDAALESSSMVAQSAAVMYLDLDRFKAINSLHGRAVGDDVLRWVGLRFKESARDAALVSRVGGDEFACLLLGHPHSGELEVIARDILTAVSSPMRIGGLDLVVAPSIGIVFGAAAGTSAGTMLQWAALAMYRARHEKLGYAFNTYARYRSARPLFQFD